MALPERVYTRTLQMSYLFAVLWTACAIVSMMRGVGTFISLVLMLLTVVHWMFTLLYTTCMMDQVEWKERA